MKKGQHLVHVSNRDVLLFDNLPFHMQMGFRSVENCCLNKKVVDTNRPKNVEWTMDIFVNNRFKIESLLKRITLSSSHEFPLKTFGCKSVKRGKIYDQLDF